MPEGTLTEDEVKELKLMLQNYNHGKWLGKFLWKACVIMGSIAAGVAAFKADIAKLFE